LRIVVGHLPHSWTHWSGNDIGGVFTSIDGGRTWKKMTNGLPTLIGRIGVKVAPCNPNVVYAIMECKEGTLFRSNDKGKSWKKIIRLFVASETVERVLFSARA
jgi:photosystem II stability/assembly factor-like uncharacterized protein